MLMNSPCLTMKRTGGPFAVRPRREGWYQNRYLAQLAEQESADRLASWSPI